MTKPQKQFDRSAVNRKMHGLLPHNTLSEMAAIKYGVESMTDLTDRQFLELYRHVINIAPHQSPKPKARRPWDAPASHGQKWIINNKLRPAIHPDYNMTDDPTFNLWAAKSLGIFSKAPQFKGLKNGQAYDMIEALKSMAARQQ